MTDLDRFAAFADMCRAKGVVRAECDGMKLEMGPAPAAPAKSANKMTAEERAEAERAGHLAAKAVRLRKLLGREPRDFELEGPEALP